MTLAETLILASYFFVLVILAVYGWHRYYLVYLYMKHKHEQPVPQAHFDDAAGRHDPAADLQRDVRRRPAGRRGLRDRLPARAARDPGAGRLDRRDPQRSPSAAVRRHAAEGIDIKYIHRDRPHRLQGRRARGRHEGGARRVHRHLRRRLHSRARLPAAHRPLLHRRQGGDGAGALGPRQRGLLAADEDPGDPARRALRARARQPQPRRLLLQLQRHRRHLAPRRDRRRRRLAARHADRGSRPQLPRAAAGLAVRLPAGSRGARPSCRWR